MQHCWKLTLCVIVAWIHCQFVSKLEFRVLVELFSISRLQRASSQSVRAVSVHFVPVWNCVTSGIMLTWLYLVLEVGSKLELGWSHHSLLLPAGMTHVNRGGLELDWHLKVSYSLAMALFWSCAASTEHFWTAIKQLAADYFCLQHCEVVCDYDYMYDSMSMRWESGRPGWRWRVKLKRRLTVH